MSNAPPPILSYTRDNDTFTLAARGPDHCFLAGSSDLEPRTISFPSTSSGSTVGEEETDDADDIFSAPGVPNSTLPTSTAPTVSTTTTSSPAYQLLFFKYGGEACRAVPARSYPTDGLSNPAVDGSRGNGRAEKEDMKDVLAHVGSWAGVNVEGQARIGGGKKEKKKTSKRTVVLHQQHRDASGSNTSAGPSGRQNANGLGYRPRTGSADEAESTDTFCHHHLGHSDPTTVPAAPANFKP